MKALELLVQQLQLQGTKPAEMAPPAAKTNKRPLENPVPEEGPGHKIGKTNPATRLNTSRSFKMFCIFR